VLDNPGVTTSGVKELSDKLDATPLIDGVQEMPYAAVDSIHQDPTEPVPYWEGGTCLSGLPPEAVDALLDVAGPGRDVPSSCSSYGGWAAR
jgi:hypothetical protein